MKTAPWHKQADESIMPGEEISDNDDDDNNKNDT